MPCLTRDSQVWLQDGNTILVSEDYIAFRVHLGTIAHRSDVFRELFALPRSVHEENMDGCPVIRLHDSSTDLRHLLLVLCCGRNYYYSRDHFQCVPFSVLESLIRVGHKYAVHDVLSEALGRLKKYYPTTLDEWDDVEGRARWVDTSPADATTVIELARLANAPSLLPTAYLTCCGLITSREHTDALRALSSEDLHRVMNASAATSRSCALRLIFMLHPSRADGCLSPDRCEATAGSLAQDIMTIDASASHMRDAHLIPDAFKLLWDGQASRSGMHSMCEACMTNTKSEHDRSRSSYWRFFPNDVFQMEIEGWQKWIV
ncbi:hypothetical protein K466DRAFT_664419 [Polyporus arcularius HHB13444]|uniref:BTB domain-containing protein n=1 Tax=Polyporus arcularius HHB13444 TaxID=1314778 RepID=A0A5C3P7B6_9APHY|nr:hypothetical protein K466DRAFT_664419 [Polyporus arcularius HHB13444]